MIKLATVFSGIGAVEHALERLKIPYEIVFACDNGERRLKTSYEAIAEATAGMPVLRARIGASQADISERIGISRQTYNAIENGKKSMSWTVFLALYAVFSNDERTLQMLNSIDIFRENSSKEH